MKVYDPSDRALYQTEIRNLIALEDSGLVPRLYFSRERTLALGMEFIAGPTLSEHFHALDGAGRASLVRQIWHSLETIHEAYNFVHQDLKPSNILIRPSRSPNALDAIVFVDWEMGCNVRRSTLSDYTLRGTPGFRAEDDRMDLLARDRSALEKSLQFLETGSMSVPPAATPGKKKWLTWT